MSNWKENKKDDYDADDDDDLNILTFPNIKYLIE